MLDYGIVGFVLLAIVSVWVGALLVAQRRIPVPARLLMLAVVLRIVGSLIRYSILMNFYGGVGDALGYYGDGIRFARRLWDLDLSVFGFEQWFGGPGSWWGTQFMGNLSGLVVSVLGPTMLGEFLFFSMLCFLGLYCMVVAFHEVADDRAVYHYAMWIWLWPSLWYWPSSIGKESVVLFATGLVTLGFVGRKEKIRWGLYMSGLALAFCIRPHYGAFLALASFLANSAGSWRRFTLRHLFEAVAVALFAIVAFSAMNAQFGIETADIESMQEFIDEKAAKTLKGGSSVGSLPSGVAGLPAAFMNIWMRPFIWDADNVPGLLSAIEVLVLWYLLWRFRKGLLAPLRQWHRNRLIRYATFCLLGYTLMIGYTFGNLGIIARQRTPLPCLACGGAPRPNRSFIATPPRRRRPETCRGDARSRSGGLPEWTIASRSVMRPRTTFPRSSSSCRSVSVTRGPRRARSSSGGSTSGTRSAAPRGWWPKPMATSSGCGSSCAGVGVAPTGMSPRFEPWTLPPTPTGGDEASSPS